MKRKEKKEKPVCTVSKIGGQAVLEGVMMRGERSLATAVRAPSGEITIESERVKPAKDRALFLRLPIVRGVYSFVMSLVTGTKIIMRSAEVYGDYEEPSKFENWLAKKFKVNVMDVLMGISVVLGLLLAVGLFTVVPSIIVSALYSIPALEGANQVLVSLTQGLLKLLIFVLYIVLVSKIKDIKRLFRYHGAEHKVINCFEHGLPMTVENAQSMSTKNARCGTTFMFLVIFVSIIVLSLVSWLVYDVIGFSYDGAAKGVVNALVRIGLSIAILPFVAGIAYEFLKLFAKYDNFLFRAFRAPGMWLQKLTTKEPDDEMVEVALAAFMTVQEMDKDETIPTTKFNVTLGMDYAKKKILETLGENPEESDADWILAEVTGKGRGELALQKAISTDKYERALEIAKRRSTGEPLQYILGYADFYGIKISVSPAVLIPRPETELLAEQVIKAAKGFAQDETNINESTSDDGAKRATVLDLCTGSGAIAMAVSKLSGAKVFASDISAPAVELAKGNALKENLDIKFFTGDLLAPFAEDTRFDIIVSNPPYIPSGDIETLDINVKGFEPLSALDGGGDGLDVIRRIAKGCRAHLKESGMVMLEMGIGQSEAVRKLFEDEGFTVEILKDLSGIDRIVKAY